MVNAMSRFALSGARVLHRQQEIFAVSPDSAVAAVLAYIGGEEGEPPILIVGSANCCFGNVFMLERQQPAWRLSSILTVDTNVMDVYPVSVICKDAGFPSEDGLLVAGFGCAGAGVRLISTCYPRARDIVPTAEYTSVIPPGEQSAPMFRVDGGRLFVDIRKAAYRPKPNRPREAELPSACACRHGQFQIQPDLWHSIDLTGRLSDAGVKIDHTLSAGPRFARIRQE